MTQVTWSSTFEIGIKEVDDQHRRLVEMINKLDQPSTPGISLEAVAEVMVDLVEYTREHFSTEERVMEEIGCPRRELHHQLHKEFRDRIKGLLLRLKQGSAITPRELQSLLAEWLIKHIMRDDKEIGLHYKKLQACKTSAPA